MANNIKSTITYDANLSSALAQIKTLTAQVNILNASMNDLDKNAVRVRTNLATAFSSNIGAIGGFTTKFVNMSDVVDNFGKKLAQNKLTMREYFSEAYRGITRQDSLMKQFARNQARYMESVGIGIGANNGKTTGMIITPNQLDLKNAATRMNVLNQEFNTFRHLVNQGANEMINFGKNTQWTGRQLTVGLTMPVVLFGATFAKTFMDIDKELTRFGKVYGQDLVGNNAAATAKMKQQVMDLAKTISSQYGIAASETAALAADIAATGKEGQDLLDTVSQTSRLAVLGEVDKQDAMKATLAIQTAFKQNTNELADSINFLNAVENQTSTTLNDLVEAIPKAGPVIKGLGGSIKDLSVLMVAMKEGGIPAAEAANAIKSGMASLINPTQKAADTAKEFGVNLTEIVQSNKGQLMPTLFALQQSLDGLDSFSRSRVIEEIFGKYQFARISALFNNLGKAGSQTEQAMKLAEASTVELANVANQELKTYTESTTVRFQRMMETVKNQLLPVGESLLKLVTPALEKLSGVLEFLSKMLDKTPDSVKNFLGVIAGFALVAGPILMLVGLMKQLVGNTIKFGIGIVSLGARLAGLKPGKLEVLDTEAMAAKIGIDNLTTSFATQETAVAGLRRELELYVAALKRTSEISPTLFTHGAKRAPIRRASGSNSPENVPGGYGGGDIIPALLEPGEFVMNKQASLKFAPILSAMNRGTLQGFAEGFDPFSSSPSDISFESRDSRTRQWRARYPKALGKQETIVDLIGENAPSSELARMHIGPSSGLLKNIRSKEGREALKYLGWLRELWIIGSQAQNQFENFAGGGIGREKAMAIRRYFQDDLTAVAQSEQEVSRIMQALESGVMVHSQDVDTYRRALERFGSRTMDGMQATEEEWAQISAAVNQAAAATSFDARHPNFQGYGVRGATPQEKAKAFVTQTGVSRSLTSFMGKSEFSQLNVETQAQIRRAQADAQESARLIAVSLKQLGETAVDEVTKAIAHLPQEIQAEVMSALEAASPSRAVERISEVAGRSIGEGALIGIEKGLNAIASKKSSIAASIEASGRKIAELEKERVIASRFGVAGQQRINDIDEQILEEKQKIETAQRHITKLSRTEQQLQSDKVEIEQRMMPLVEQEYTEVARAAATPNQVGTSGTIPVGGPINNANQGTAKGGRFGRLFGTGMVSMGLFGITGVTSTLGMFNESLGESTQGLNNFLFALSSIVSVLEMISMFKGGGMLGLGGAGARAAGTAGAAGAAKGVAGAAEGVAGAAGRAGMLSRLLPVAGGVGAAGGVALGAIALAAFYFYQMKKAADEARAAASAAFIQPTETAKAFGLEIKTVEQALNDASAKSIFVAKELQTSLTLDPQIVESIKTEYASLIESIKKQSSLGAGRELAMAFNNMLIQGLDSEQAKAAVIEIAKAAGKESAVSFIKEFTTATDVKSAIKSQTELLSKSSLLNATKLADKERSDRANALLKDYGVDPTLFAGGLTGAATVGDMRQRVVRPESLSFIPGENPNFVNYGPQLNKFFSEVYSNLVSIGQSTDIEQQAAILEQLGIVGVETSEQVIEATNKVKQAFTEQLNIINTQIDEYQQANVTYLSLLDQNGQYYVDLTKKFIDSLVVSYSKAPQEAFDAYKSMGDQLAGVSEESLQPLKDKLKEIAPEYEVILKDIHDGRTLMLAFAAATQGIPVTAIMSVKDNVLRLDDALLKAKTSAQLLYDTLAQQYEQQIQELKNSLTTKLQADAAVYQANIDQIIETRDAELEALETTSRRRQREHDKEIRRSDRKIDAYEKESKQLGRVADAYIRSLQKRKRAEDFYSRQSQTGLGALKSLASGDVFGYLEARAKMSSDAEQEALDKSLQQIEERKRAEQEVIDLKIEAEQEYRKELDRSFERFQRQQERKKRQITNDAADNLATERGYLADVNTELSNIDQDIKDGLKKFRSIYGDAVAKPYLEALGKAQELLYTQEILRGATQLDAYWAAFGKAPETYQPSGSEYSGQGVVTLFKNPYTGKRLPTKTELTQTTTVGNGTQDIQIMLPNGKVITISAGATGGYVSGPGTGTSDSIPAMLSNGEFVIRADSVSKYGIPMMNAINTGKFNMGGLANKYNMPTYKMGGMTSSNNLISTKTFDYKTNPNVFNIQVNAGNVDNVDLLTDIIVTKINRSMSRRNHGRSIG